MIGAIVIGLNILGAIIAGSIYAAIGILIADHLKAGHYTKACKDQAEGADWGDPGSFFVALFWPIATYVLMSVGLSRWIRKGCLADLYHHLRKTRVMPKATAREKKHR